MKINNDCTRKILIEIEKISYGETITIAKLQEKIPEYSIEEVLNIITLLNKGHFLNILDKLSYDDNDVFRDNKIKCLTERGYKALDLIRDDEVWNQIKSKITNFDELSIYTILDIASRIMAEKYNMLFELPNNLFVIDNKW